MTSDVLRCNNFRPRKKDDANSNDFGVFAANLIMTGELIKILIIYDDL